MRFPLFLLGVLCAVTMTVASPTPQGPEHACDRGIVTKVDLNSLKRDLSNKFNNVENVQNVSCSCHLVAFP